MQGADSVTWTITQTDKTITIEEKVTGGQMGGPGGGPLRRWCSGWRSSRRWRPVAVAAVDVGVWVVRAPSTWTAAETTGDAGPRQIRS